MTETRFAYYPVFASLERGSAGPEAKAFETERFFCDIYCLEPGQAQKGHVHGEQDKIYIVLDGQGTFQVGKEEQVLAPGQGIMASAGEEHGVRNHTQQRLTVLVFVAPNPT